MTSQMQSRTITWKQDQFYLVLHAVRVALLRLALQKLCKELGEGGKDINSDIANLVKKGLRPSIQKALDIVRVTGNESIHPGVLDMKDNRDVALKLLSL